MLCDLSRELLSAYLDEELPSRDSLSLERHLRACPDCTARLTELRAVRNVLASLEEVAPPAEFHASLHARLLAAAPVTASKVTPISQGRKRVWNLHSANRWVAAAAAAAVMTISAGTYYLQMASQPGPDVIAQATSPADEPGDKAPVFTPGSNSKPTAPGPDGSTAQGGAAGHSDAPAPSRQEGSQALVPDTGNSQPDTGVQPPAVNRDDGVSAATPTPRTGSTGTSATSAKPPAPEDEGALLVYQADLQIQAKFDEMNIARLLRVQQELGGTFKTLGVTPLDSGARMATVVIRVPTDQYQTARNMILAIGPSLLIRESGPVDVRADVNRLRQRLESLIVTDAQANAQEIEDLQKQLADYYDQARYATLRVSLIE